MRRTLTFLLMLFTLAFWSAGLWSLSAHLNGESLIYAAAPAAAAFLLMIGLFLSGRIFSPNDAVRRVFSAMLAVTLLLAIALAYADVFFLSGEIFRQGLAIWRLDIFYDERFVLTLAFSAGIAHPVLFIVCGVALLCLPPPKDGFSMRS